jgi:anti-anti-sigma factor
VTQRLIAWLKQVYAGIAASFHRARELVQEVHKYMESATPDLPTEIAHLQQLVHRRDAILTAMAEVARILSASFNPLQQAPEMLALIGKAIGVSRSYIFANETTADGLRAMSQRVEWTNSGFDPQIDNPDLQLVPYHEAGFGRWETFLSQNQVLYGKVEDFSAEEQAILEAQDIISLLVAPIFVHEQWWGFMGFDDCETARVWEPSEVETLRSAATMFGATLHSQQTHQENLKIQQQVIEAQREALRELSTPLIPLTDTVVLMPIIGTIDSQRAQVVMEKLLEGVAQHRAGLVILDITGVSVVDTQVAMTFVQAAQAVRLLGARVMLTGIQPQIAQTLVHLGVDLGGIQTRGSLQSGIAAALREQ